MKKKKMTPSECIPALHLERTLSKKKKSKKEKEKRNMIFHQKKESKVTLRSAEARW